MVKTSTFRWRPKTAIGAAFAEAKRTGHGVMIDFGAKWCAPCEEMNSRTFSDEGVRKAIAADFIPVQVDVTESTDADEQIQKRYEAMTLPAIIFFAPNGTEIGRVSDFQPPDTFVKSVREFAAARKRG